MNLNGIWKNSINDELIHFYRIENTDEYILSYGIELINSEKVELFITNSNHAHMPYSKKFGRIYIIIVDTNRIYISNDLFVRQEV